jgi:tetratricopeptide (TPR) repeat protein
VERVRIDSAGGQRRARNVSGADYGSEDLQLDIAETLSTAETAHRAGRFAEAEALYRDFLGRKPGRADAAKAHLSLGLVLRDGGMHEAAIAHMKRRWRWRPMIRSFTAIWAGSLRS